MQSVCVLLLLLLLHVVIINKRNSLCSSGRRQCRVGASLMRGLCETVEEGGLEDGPGL